MPYKSKASAYFSPRRPPKPPAEAKWYTKKRITLNAKLRQAIMDLLPFDVDKNEADVILWTIFDTIVEGAIRDNKVVIEGLGKFMLHTRPATRSALMESLGKDKLRYTHKINYIPARTYLKFIPCYGLRKSLIDKEEDNGNNHTT